ncbi:hypothetical protein L1887_49882 [Cichorium endivia]|nr:hypothetical protein L1887_49882 [Cichorium endivia]
MLAKSARVRCESTHRLRILTLDPARHQRCVENALRSYADSPWVVARVQVAAAAVNFFLSSPVEVHLSSRLCSTKMKIVSNLTRCNFSRMGTGSRVCLSTKGHREVLHQGTLVLQTWYRGSHHVPVWMQTWSQFLYRTSISFGSKSGRETRDTLAIRHTGVHKID